MSFVCEDNRTWASLQKWVRSSNVVLIRPKFFFWNPGNQLQKSIEGLLRSILHQIFKAHPESISPETTRGPQLSWTKSGLLKAFKTWTNQNLGSYQICFFIDGLDESDDNQESLVNLIQELTENGSTKVVLSSRPYPIFRRVFGHHAMLRLQDLTQDDMENFVLDKFVAHPNISTIASRSQELAKDWNILRIVNHISRSSNGVFQWVALAVRDQMDGLEDGDSMDQLMQRAEVLPTELEDLYLHLLSKIKKVHQEEVAILLRFALYDIDATYEFTYFQRAPHMESLLDFTLAAYESLDGDLGSFDEFPWQQIVENAPRVKNRINATCFGLLEAHQVPRDKQALSESDESDLSVRENIEILKKESPVKFLHRSVVDFLRGSQDAQTFLDAHTPANFSAATVVVKVLVAKARMFGLGIEHWDQLKHEGSVNLDLLMIKTCDAEYETGKAQIALHDYVDRMGILQTGGRRLMREKGLPMHWSLRIRDWYWRAKIFAISNHTFESASESSSNSRKSRLLRSVPEVPIDYLGLSVTYGMGIFLQQHINDLGYGLRFSDADYLLRCAIEHSVWRKYKSTFLHARVLQIACALLKSGADPNNQFKATTIWGLFLMTMCSVKHMMRFGYRSDLSPEFPEEAWQSCFQCFVESGADTNGILEIGVFPWFVFDIKRGHLHTLSAFHPSPTCQTDNPCHYTMNIKASVPKLIRYCLGSSTISEELYEKCILQGAQSFSRIIDINIVCNRRYTQLRLDQHDSDQLLKAYEQYLIPTGHPSPFVQTQFESHILKILEDNVDISTDEEGYSTEELL